MVIVRLREAGYKCTQAIADSLKNETEGFFNITSLRTTRNSQEVIVSTWPFLSWSTVVGAVFIQNGKVTIYFSLKSKNYK